MAKSTGHIVFDCDGTLISSLVGIQKALVVLFSEFLNREVTLEEVRQNYTANTAKIIENFGIDPNDETLFGSMKLRWLELSNNMGSKFDLFPEITELIEELIDLNYKLYVWTARDRMSTISILKELNLISKFEEIRCYDDTMPKPHPMGLEEMVGDFDKSKTVVIGDSLADIEGARNFSCRAIAAIWSDGINEDELERIGPDYIAKNPLSCLDFIKENIK